MLVRRWDGPFLYDSSNQLVQHNTNLNIKQTNKQTEIKQRKNNNYKIVRRRRGSFPLWQWRPIDQLSNTILEAFYRIYITYLLHIYFANYFIHLCQIWVAVSFLICSNMSIFWSLYYFHPLALFYCALPIAWNQLNFKYRLIPFLFFSGPPFFN